MVLGYFALQVINPAIVQDLLGTMSTFTIMAAGIGVGILTIPLVASVAEDAMYAVPGALREAAYGIGARRRTVTTKVVFPAAVSGVVASLILGSPGRSARRWSWRSRRVRPAVLDTGPRSRPGRP